MLRFPKLRLISARQRKVLAIVEQLEAGRDPLRAKLDRRFTEHYARGFLQWPLAELRPESETQTHWQQTQLMRFIAWSIEKCFEDLQNLEKHYSGFVKRIQGAGTPDERQRVMIQFLGELGASKRQLRADIKAFNRWFAQDGVVERFEHLVAETERQLIYLLERLGPVAHDLLVSQTDPADAWHKARLESVLLPALTFPGHVRVREAGMQALGDAMQALPAGSDAGLATTTVSYLYRCALDASQPVSLQYQTLPILWRAAPEQLTQILRQRLLRQAFSADDFFFRRRALLLLIEAVAEQPDLWPLLDSVKDDPSAYVRQAFAQGLADLPDEHKAPLLGHFLADREETVRAMALLQLPRLVTQPGLGEAALAGLLAALCEHQSDFELKVALHVAPGMIAALRATHPPAAKDFSTALEKAITGVHQHHPKTKCRRWASLAREHLASLSNIPPELRAQLSQLRDGLPLGHSGKLELNPAVQEAELGRAMVSYTDGHFGFNLHRSGTRGSNIASYKVVRDYFSRFRLWRMLHEWRSPATDKRQNYGHLSGRVYPGLLQVPAQHVAELSPTKVPGEPLFLAEEGGWRPYLPLVDQLISALDQDWPTRPLCIYTPEGVTWVTPPSGFISRLRARWRLTRHFAHFALMRNWTPNSPFKPSDYLQAVAELGFQFQQTPYTDSQGQRYPTDSRVARFFPALALPLGIPEVWGEYQTYFYSAYQNTLEQLLIFVAALLCLFFGRHLYLNLAMRRARKLLPLVVGGWGTRGKSGTERLKAAVFNAMGYQVLSKTTGCEAMFLHGHALRPLREMFLFRPYDKATIWEQVNLARLAGRMQADVMLWECMGLTPRYVEILQRQWMRDDLSTITNCYPDHEDIQGPAGVDLPRVIARFIPRRGRLTTSEENMLPFLLEEARQQETPVSTVNWLEAGLITPDVIARFPYEEHPYNIALVVRMGEGIGIPADFSLKEMADRVIPDLGVLKVYPRAHLYGRRIEFINGMSANERHGTLSNWLRMGMDRHSVDSDPQVWVSTVVNNRDDRIARSQVFASILVNDISADRHYLIGGNVDGLMTYIHHAFEHMAAELDWSWRTVEERDACLELLERLATQYRVPQTADVVTGRLRAMLTGSGLESAPAVDSESDLMALLASGNLDLQGRDRLLAQWRQDQNESASYQTLREQLTSQSGEHLREPIKAALWAWLQARLHVVEDYHASGNQLIDMIAQDSPPGLLNRLMGIQNIKGTGLDFIYRWQAWDAHHKALKQLRGDDPLKALEGVKNLASTLEFGVLEERPVLEAVAEMKAAPQAQTELFQAQLKLIESNLQYQLAQVRESLGSRRKTGGLQKKIITWIEHFLDAGEAVRRRKKADRIYKDLTNLRISHARAATELKTLTQAQKGGWLEARRAGK